MFHKYHLTLQRYYKFCTCANFLRWKLQIERKRDKFSSGSLSVSNRWAYDEHTISIRWAYIEHTLSIRWAYIENSGVTRGKKERERNKDKKIPHSAVREGGLGSLVHRSSYIIYWRFGRGGQNDRSSGPICVDEGELNWNRGHRLDLRHRMY